MATTGRTDRRQPDGGKSRPRRRRRRPICLWPATARLSTGFAPHRTVRQTIRHPPPTHPPHRPSDHSLDHPPDHSLDHSPGTKRSRAVPAESPAKLVRNYFNLPLIDSILPLKLALDMNRFEVFRLGLAIIRYMRRSEITDAGCGN